MIYYIDWLYILLGIMVLPGIIFAAWAQSRVHSVYTRASKMHSIKGIPTQEMARRVLDAAGLENVQIERIPGKLSDHYNMRTRTIGISQSNWNSTSVAALGVVAHEIGHAIQHKKKYAPLKIQQIFGTMTNIITRWMLVFLLFAILSDVLLISYGVTSNLWVIYSYLGIYGLSLMFSMFTLPVEFNASARTRQILFDSGLLTEDEFNEAKNVLNAAALTYVAAAVVSFLYFLRILVYVLMITGNSRRK